MASLRNDNLTTERDVRLAIQTALRFRVLYTDIQKELNVTRSQI
jgi:hypothetical protein